MSSAEKNAGQAWRQTRVVTHAGALDLIAGAIAHADAISVPQCIVVVDPSGEVIASLRMDGAKFLSTRTALAKARTAASTGSATGRMPLDVGTAASVSAGGAVTPLPGGLPVCFNGELAGAIGIGSGTGDEDIAVARAALLAVGADAFDA